MKTVSQRTSDYVRKRLEHELSGHDWHHVERVWKTAAYLQSKEGGNLKVIELAVLLHSAAERDYKAGTDEKVRPLALSGIIDVLDIEEEFKPLIISIIQLCKFRGSETEKPYSLEGKIVQDANWLDSLGAIGIARNFTAGGYIGRKIYDPDIKPKEDLDPLSFIRSKKERTSVAYFYEKAFLIPDMLNTKTGREIAVKRTAYVKDFIKRFLEEWYLQDITEGLSEPLDIAVPAELQ